MTQKIILNVNERSVELNDCTANDDGSISINLFTTRGVAMETGHSELWVNQQRQWSWLRPLFKEPVNGGYLYTKQDVDIMKQELNLDRKEMEVEYTE